MVKRTIILVVVLLVLIGGLILAKTTFKDKEENSNPNIVVSVKSNQTITSPFQINGKARGFWFFEASFPIKLIDENNNILTIGIAQAKGNWMTSDFVDFEAKIEFFAENDGKGFLIFNRDNPSGLSENNEEFRLPVIIKATN
jgi:hypothetical protein